MTISRVDYFYGENKNEPVVYFQPIIETVLKKKDTFHTSAKYNKIDINVIYNTIESCKSDIAFFNKVQKSLRLRIQYFLNVYFWTFKWMENPQNNFISNTIDESHSFINKQKYLINKYFMDITVENHEVNTKYENLLAELENYEVKRPSFHSFNWITLIGIAYGAGLSYTSAMDAWMQYKKPVYDFFTKNLWKSIILEPLTKIVNTLNNTDTKDMSIMASEYTIMNEKDSLKEQYELFLANNHTEKMALTGVNKEDELERKFLHLYNTIVNKPWSSLAKGDLITVLMITLQRIKLEANVSLASIDKIIESQNLLMKLIGITPAFAILIATYKFVIKPILYDAPLSFVSNIIQIVQNQFSVINDKDFDLKTEYITLIGNLMQTQSKKSTEEFFYFYVAELANLGMHQIPKSLHLTFLKQISLIVHAQDSKEICTAVTHLDTVYHSYFY